MKKKIIVSALALAIGTGLAGSVTSTIAWYQYSTRTTAAYLGIAGGTSGNLQMRFREDGQAADAGWTTKILKEDMETYLSGKSRATNVVPVTSGEMARNDTVPAKLYQNPVYGRAAQTSWKEATDANYAKIELEFRFVENEANVAKDIYLSDLFIAQDESDTTHEDISSAIRFHVSAYTDPAAKISRLVSKNGGTIDTHGYLDLNGDGDDDVEYAKKSDKYGFTNGAGTKISYGGNDATQENYAAKTTGLNPILVDLENGIKDDNRKLGTTVAGSASFLNVDITIWVEGWQELPEGDANAKAIWEADDYLGAKFDVGFEFEADIE